MHRLKIVIVAVLIILTVSSWNKSNAWASPNQSPDYQTVPTRVKTPTNTPVTPTMPSSEGTSTNTPTSKSNSSKPTDTQTLALTAIVASATLSQIVNATETQIAIASQVTPNLSVVPPTTTLSPTISMTATSSEAVVLPIVTPSSQSLPKTGSSALVIILAGLILAALVTIVFMLHKGRLQ